MTTIKKGLRFVNARRMGEKHPNFYVPPPKAISKLKIGDCVKIARKAERFWVEITDVKKNHFIGKVANGLSARDLKLGDLIKFRDIHIYNIE